MTTDSLADHLRQQLVRHLVSRTILCPRTHQVLDVRTCVVILDADGDPAFVMSQAGWAEAAATDGLVASIATRGYTVDPATVRSPR